MISEIIKSIIVIAKAKIFKKLILAGDILNVKYVDIINIPINGVKINAVNNIIT